MKRIFVTVVSAILFLGVDAGAQSRATGYYKDLFVDSGIRITDHEFLPAARVLNLTVEKFCTPYDMKAITETDRALLSAYYCGSDEDVNGHFLYPDGAPRFRMIYVPGGNAGIHGRALTEVGRAHLLEFYANGGSYSGSCAGCILCANGYCSKNGTVSGEAYFKLWPGYIAMTHLHRSSTPMSVDSRSPLLKYYDFGGDLLVDSVRHNGGCYMSEVDMPEGTEPLMRYVGDSSEFKAAIDGKISVMGYKASPKSGRVVVTGSHPEAIPTGERLQMFTAMLHYALDGNGEPQVKASLVSGAPREMTLYAEDGKPEFTAIGDRQYHHFTIDVPKGTGKVVVDLRSVAGRDDYDLFLYAAPGQFAFNDVAKWMNVGTGVSKSLVITNPKAGKLYISVFCDTTVDVVKTRNGDRYTGRVDVLNGVPYIITATLSKQ